MDRTLPLHERMMITVHLWMCKYCKRLKNQLLIISKAVQLVEIPEEKAGRSSYLPQETRMRIKQAIKDLSV